MNDGAGELVWTDAQILIAIHQGEASIASEIRGYVDWQQHIVLTDEEMQSGLQRLISVGWVEIADAIYRVTPAFRDALRVPKTKRRVDRNGPYYQLLGLKT